MSLTALEDALDKERCEQGRHIELAKKKNEKMYCLRCDQEMPEGMHYSNIRGVEIYKVMDDEEQR